MAAVFGGLVVQTIAATVPAFRKVLEIEHLTADSVARTSLAVITFVGLCAIATAIPRPQDRQR